MYIKSHFFFPPGRNCGCFVLFALLQFACSPVFYNLWFMQEYAEFQYRRRHRQQRRRGDVHSLLSNPTDPDGEPSESTFGELPCWRVSFSLKFIFKTGCRQGLSVCNLDSP